MQNPQLPSFPSGSSFQVKHCKHAIYILIFLLLLCAFVHFVFPLPAYKPLLQFVTVLIKLSRSVYFIAFIASSNLVYLTIQSLPLFIHQ